MNTRTYIIGFISCLALTLAAYFLATDYSVPKDIALILVAILAVAQFVVQMVCFLHLNTEPASRDKLVVLGATGIVVLILVVGSLWIMSSLNQRMMPTSEQMEQYMNGQTGI